MLARTGPVFFLLFLALQAKSACVSPTALTGARDFNTSTGKYQLCTTEGWIDFIQAGPGSSCAGHFNGSMNYNTEQSRFEVCDGTDWQRVGFVSGGSCSISSLSYITRLTNSTEMNNAFNIRPHPDGDKILVGGQYSERIAIYDISTPSSPSFIASASNSNLSNSYEFVVVGNYVYATGSDNNNLVVIDVSDPSSPSYVTRVQSTDPSQMSNIWSVDKSNDDSHVFTLSWNSGSPSACWIHGFDITIPTSPTQTFAFNVSSEASTGSAFCERIRVHENQAYISFPAGGQLVRIDISNPSSPTYLSKASNSTAEDQRTLALSNDGRYAFSTTSSGARFNAWDLSQPHPTSISHLAQFQDTTHIGQTYGMTVKGDYAFVGRFDSNRLTVVDISDPSTPSVTTSLSNTNMGAPGNSAIIGQYAYVPLYYAHGFAVVDLGCDPTPSEDPAQFGSCTRSGKINFFSDEDTLAWCDGSRWRTLASVAASNLPLNFELALSSSQSNFHLGDWLTSQGWDGERAVNVSISINSGVVISSNSVATPAFVIPSLPEGSTVTLTNNGRIQGRGGTGGTGGSGCTSAGLAGQPGGDAISTAHPVTIANASGEIWAGGGGGGGGGGGADWSCSQPGSGGGGGAGTQLGSGGSPGGCISYPANPGSAGTATAGGAGGAAPPPLCPSATGGAGGSGGGPGLAGSAGTSGFGSIEWFPGGAGGAPGRYIVGNAQVTWSSNGDRRGNVTP